MNLTSRSKKLLNSCARATVAPDMWPFHRHRNEEEKRSHPLKRLIVGLIIGGAIGSIVGSKILEKHRKEEGVKDKDEE